MYLEAIKNFSEKRPGGLKKLASDAGMSEQNLHRCIRVNRISAEDLERLARVLRVPVATFFDGDLPASAPPAPPANTITIRGNKNTAALHSSAPLPSAPSPSAPLTTTADTAMSYAAPPATSDRVAYLEAILAEKERLISVLMKRLNL